MHRTTHSHPLPEPNQRVAFIDPVQQLHGCWASEVVCVLTSLCGYIWWANQIAKVCTNLLGFGGHCVTGPPVLLTFVHSLAKGFQKEPNSQCCMEDSFVFTSIISLFIDCCGGAVPFIRFRRFNMSSACSLCLCPVMGCWPRMDPHLSDGECWDDHSRFNLWYCQLGLTVPVDLHPNAVCEPPWPSELEFSAPGRDTWAEQVRCSQLPGKHLCVFSHWELFGEVEHF